MESEPRDIQGRCACGADDADADPPADELRRRYALLTAKERDIMELVVIGKTSREIARRLAVSRRTVEVHRLRIMKKMGVATATKLVRLACEHGLRVEAGRPPSEANG